MRIDKGSAYSLHHHAGNLVRVGVARWSSVLKVTLALLCTLSRNSDAGTTVGDTPAKLINVSSLMSAGQTLAVTLSVDFNMFDVALLELLHSRLNVLHPAFLTHRLSRYVGVETGAVPVTGDRFRVEGDDDTEFFGDAVQQETGHPQLVANYDLCEHSVPRASGACTYDRYPHTDRLEIPIEQA